MTDSDLEFVREIRARINPAFANTVGTESYERTRLINLLIESEGMRKKAEFWRIHRTSFGYCITCELKKSKRHDWTAADWIAAKRKEIEG